MPVITHRSILIETADVRENVKQLLVLVPL
jgi:hypothetical protein